MTSGNHFGPRNATAQSVWTEADFESMGWHDNVVHGFALEPDLEHASCVLIDLDYIVEWVKPIPPERQITFWIAPATLVFRDARDVTFDMDETGIAFRGMSLDGILGSEQDLHGFRTWTLAGHEFTLTVRSQGFTQYLRRRPIRSTNQRLDLVARGGLGFDEAGFS